MDCSIDNGTRIVQNNNSNGEHLMQKKEMQIKKYQSLLQEAAEAYLVNRYNIATNLYVHILQLIDEINDENIKQRKYIVKYMLCKTYMYSTQLQDLIESFHNLKSLESTVGNKFPAVYYALGEVHYKFYRFELAQIAINKGLTFLQSDINFEKEYIPGTQYVIKETTKDGLLEALYDLKDKCSGWHPPDAICSLQDCQNFTQPYMQPSRNIFFSDPTFSGLVVITCNNSTNSCEIKFHQVCWKAKKEMLSPITKLSDKNVLNLKCLTPNCEENGELCRIAKVTVIDENGATKTFVENSATNNSPTKVNICKGAIRKQPNNEKVLKQSIPTSKPVTKLNKRPQSSQPIQLTSQPKESFFHEREELDWRLARLIELRERNFNIPLENDWRPDKEMYGNDFLISNTRQLPDPTFDNDPLGAKKSFVFLYFYSIVENDGPTRQQNIVDQWKTVQALIEISCSNVIHDKYANIIEFLLQSCKFVKVGEYICIPKQLPHVYNLFKDDTVECMRILMKTPVEEPEETEAVVEDFMNEIMLAEDITEKKIEVTKDTTNFENPYKINNDDYDNYNCFSDDEHDYYMSSCNKDNCTKEDKSYISENNIIHMVKDTIVVEDQISDDEDDLFDGDFFLSKEEYFRQKNKTCKAINNENDTNLENSIPANFSAKNHLQGDVLNNKFIDSPQCFNFASRDMTNSTKENTVYSKDNEKVTHNSVCTNNNIPDTNSQTNINDLELILSELKSTKNVDKFVQVMDNYNKNELKGVVAKLLEKQTTLERQVMEKDQQLKTAQESVDMCKDILPTLAWLQQNYEEIKNDNVRLGGIVADLEQQKMMLHGNISSSIAEHNLAQQYEEQHAQLLTTLQNVKIELEENAEKVESLSKTLQDNERTYMKKLLGAHYAASINLIDSRLNFCQCAVDVIAKFNSAAESILGYKLINPQEWERTLLSVEDIKSENTNYLEKLSAKLQNGEIIEELDLQLSQAPPLPKITLGETIRTALYIFCYHHVNVLRIQRPSIPIQSPLYFPPRASYYHGAQVTAMGVCGPQVSFAAPQVYSANQTLQTSSQQSYSIKEVAKDDSKSCNSTNNDSTSKDDQCENTVENIHPACNAAERSDRSEKKPLLLLKYKTMDSLLERMREKFIGVPDIDLIESIKKVREAHNNSLTGLEIKSILAEASIIVEQIQITRNENMKLGMKDVYANNVIPDKAERVESQQVGNRQTLVLKNIPSLYHDIQKLPKREKKKIPVSNKTWEIIENKVDSWEKENEESECGICFESMIEVGVYSLRCKHTFHTQCLRSWFRHNQSCPNCRVFCTLDDEFPPLP